MFLFTQIQLSSLCKESDLGFIASPNSSMCGVFFFHSASTVQQCNDPQAEKYSNAVCEVHLLSAGVNRPVQRGGFLLSLPSFLLSCPEEEKRESPVLGKRRLMMGPTTPPGLLKKKKAIMN